MVTTGNKYFHMSFGEMDITLNDVPILAGISVMGRSVNTPQRITDAKEMVVRLLGVSHELGMILRCSVRLEWRRSKFSDDNNYKFSWFTNFLSLIDQCLSNLKYFVCGEIRIIISSQLSTYITKRVEGCSCVRKQKKKIKPVARTLFGQLGPNTVLLFGQNWPNILAMFSMFSEQKQDVWLQMFKYFVTVSIIGRTYYLCSVPVSRANCEPIR